MITMARNKRASYDEEIEFDFPHLVEHRDEPHAACRRLLRRVQAEPRFARYDDLLSHRLASCSAHDSIRRRLATLPLHH